MGFENKNVNVCMIAYSNYKSDPRIRREAEALAQHGAKVTILSLAESIKPQVSEFHGVTIQEVGVRKFQGRSNVSYIFSYILFVVKAFFACSSMALRGLIDIVHVHNMPDFLVFSALVPRIMGKMLILDIHDSMLETYLGKFGRLNPLFARLLVWEEKICTAFASRVICVNHIQMIPVMKRGTPEEKITIVLNVPDETIFKTPEKKVITEKRIPFKCVYHGTLDTMLGIDFAIKAVESIRERISEIQFHIMGKGKDSTEFEQYITEKNLSKYILLNKNGVPVDSLRPVLLTMDLGIIPNRKNIGTELMLPVKLLEYVALRIPVVVPELKAIKYYFSDDMVRYYEPENIESLEEAIEDIYNRPDRGAAQADCALQMLRKYGWKKHKYDLIKLYGIETVIEEELEEVPSDVMAQI
jgi:glycosyltransferase involved in cell wall biosynthesis